jgi:hypothetical protein
MGEVMRDWPRIEGDRWPKSAQRRHAHRLIGTPFAEAPGHFRIMIISSWLSEIGQELPTNSIDEVEIRIVDLSRQGLAQFQPPWSGARLPIREWDGHPPFSVRKSHARIHIRLPSPIVKT